MPLKAVQNAFGPRGVATLLLASSLAALSAGVVAGIVFQRSYGVGALLRVLPRSGEVARTVPPDTGAVGVPEQFHGRLSLFVLAGQSNMSGLGDLPEKQTRHPRILVFGNDYRWRPALEPIDSPLGQVDEVSKDSAAGFGPGLSFALAVATERPDMVIGLVPCAKGDTDINQWQRSHRDSTLYGSCLKRIRAASLEGRVAASLFFQGEADAYDPARARERDLLPRAYAERFSAVVSSLRGDLSSPNLPVVFAQIGTQRAPALFSEWETIREQQRAINLPCTDMITTDDLPLRDPVHFTTAAYQAIGQRFAAAYLKLAFTCLTS
jgi:hypothetical protein